MRLLELHYWSDIVMFGVIAIFITSLIVLRISVLIYRKKKKIRNALALIIKQNKKILKVIGDGGVKELERQMDEWLLRLNQSFTKLEQVSEKVDSTK